MEIQKGYQEEGVLKILGAISSSCTYCVWMDYVWRDLKPLFIRKVVVRPL
jgi:hypothetical protein